MVRVDEILQEMQRGNHGHGLDVLACSNTRPAAATTSNTQENTGYEEMAIWSKTGARSQTFVMPIPVGDPKALASLIKEGQET